MAMRVIGALVLVAILCGPLWATFGFESVPIWLTSIYELVGGFCGPATVKWLQE